MKRIMYYVLTVMLFVFAGETFAQTMTELVVPKYFGSKSAASANNNRTPIAFCIQVDGLTANTTYDVKLQLGLVENAATSYGAGNIWDGTAYSGSKVSNAFTTDANGSSGPVWYFWQPTGNSSRFDAGQQHNIRLGYIEAGGTMPSEPNFVGTKVLTALDIAVTERTAATTDDGCFIKGTAISLNSGKFVLIYDNVDGDGDPLFVYQVRQATATNSNQSDLPSEINLIYTQDASSSIGDYPAIIPIGANNPNGVRRVETRNADNTISFFSKSNTGTWGSVNTTTAVRREVLVLDSVACPVPVELVSFEAAYLNNSVSLTWKTATETNNSGYEIERNVNNTAWEKIDFVAGNGTTTNMCSYSYVDTKLNVTGNISYRLKQVDFDGSVNYSNIVNVTVGTPSEYSLNQNYPNPFNPSTKISFAVPQTENVKVVLFNALGQEVATLFNGVAEAGMHSVSFDGSNLTSGIYFYQMQAGSFVSVKKMILTK